MRLYNARKQGFWQTYKVSAWNSHQQYDLCNTQIAWEYFRDIAKRETLVGTDGITITCQSVLHCFNLLRNIELQAITYERLVAGQEPGLQFHV